VFKKLTLASPEKESCAAEAKQLYFSGEALVILIVEEI